MNKEQNENMLTLVGVLTRHCPALYVVAIARNVAKLQRLAVSLHKRYEAAYSYEWAATERYEEQTEKLEKRAGELARELGAGLRTQPDPRGAPLYLIIGDKEYCIF